MYFNPLKIPADRNVFFTSDTHLNHDVDFVRGARGFSAVADMDESIVASWNSVVSNDDIVFHLGDFIIRDPDGSRAADFLRQLNGTKYLLLGNHNSGVKQLYNLARRNTSDDLDAYLLDSLGVILVGHYVPVLHRHQPMILFHFPIASWDGMDDGSWHLCGHSHGSYPASLPTSAIGGKILDVGWDVFGKPVSFDEVRVIMESKPKLVVGHHVKETK